MTGKDKKALFYGILAVLFGILSILFKVLGNDLMSVESTVCLWGAVIVMELTKNNS